MTLQQQHDDAVFFAADGAYLPLAWAAARAAAAEPGRGFDVLLLTERQPAGHAVPAPPGCQLLEVDLPQAIHDWPRPNYIPPFCCARLPAPDLWLSGYRKMLYLDADICLDGPLAPLFELDLRGAILGMVEDCGRYLRSPCEQAEFDRSRREIGLDPATPYFNSGVMLFDAAGWRAAQIWRQAAAFIETQRERLVFMDQDAINFSCRGQIAELSPRWNFQTHFFGLGLEAEMQPRILHYLNVLKPWRDPEWATLYGVVDAARLAASLQNSPWPDFIAPALYQRAPEFWRRWFQQYAARQQAKRWQRLPAADISRHVDNFQALQAQLRISVRAGFGQALRDGRYVDLCPNETQRWQQALQAA